MSAEKWSVLKARTVLHVRSNGRHVCEVSLRPSIRGPERVAIEAQAWADARLIAAAPVLLEALEAAKATIESMRSESRLHGHITDASAAYLNKEKLLIDAAINAARGKE